MCLPAGSVSQTDPNVAAQGMHLVLVAVRYAWRQGYSFICMGMTRVPRGSATDVVGSRRLGSLGLAMLGSCGYRGYSL